MVFCEKRKRPLEILLRAVSGFAQSVNWAPLVPCTEEEGTFITHLDRTLAGLFFLSTIDFIDILCYLLNNVGSLIFFVGGRMMRFLSFLFVACLFSLSFSSPSSDQGPSLFGKWSSLDDGHNAILRIAADGKYYYLLEERGKKVYRENGTWAIDSTNGAKLLTKTIQTSDMFSSVHLKGCFISFEGDSVITLVSKDGSRLFSGKKE